MNSPAMDAGLGSQQRLRDLAVLGHELRNPLAAAIAGVATAAAITPESDQCHPLLERAVRDLDRLTQLLNAYLELAGGRLRRTMVVDVAALLRTIATRRGSAALTVRARGDLRVLGNPALLERALENLIDNAFAAGAQRIELGAEREGEVVALRVQDDGAGVPEALRDSLFTPFVSGRGGTGLGLSVVADIALAHGGAVRLLPAARGARFELTLPGLVGSGSVGTSPMAAGAQACAS